MDESVFKSVKRACYAGLDSVRLRTEVAARVGRAIRFDAHAFGTADPATGLLSHLVADGMPSPLALAYADYLYPLETAAYSIDAARQGKSLLRAGEESPDLADAERATGFAFGIEVLLASNGCLWGKWCLLRETEGNAARERALLRRLVPHLSRALQHASLIDGAFDGDPFAEPRSGVIVVDHAGRALMRSPAVRPMLEDLADVGVRFDDGIPLSILTLATRLRCRARAASDGVPESAMLRARGHSGRWYVVQASLAETSPDGRESVVVVLRPMLPRELAPMLTTLYGLSSREREVVAAVVRGDTTRQIAEHLAISPHTVKEHLDRACAKTGARGRRALIARLFRDAYRPTLLS